MDKTNFDFDQNDDNFKELLECAAQVHPFALNFGKITGFKTRDGGKNYFLAEKIPELGPRADFLIVRDFDDIEDFLFTRFQNHLEINPEVDLKEKNVLFFKVKGIGPGIYADIFFGGKLDELSQEEKKDMIYSFLESMKRISLVIDLNLLS